MITIELFKYHVRHLIYYEYIRGGKVKLFRPFPFLASCMVYAAQEVCA